MIVCDHKRSITMVHTGYTGSAHDSRVLNGSPLVRKAEEKLPGEEYVLADSAYAHTKKVIPVIKNNKGRELNRQEKAFNYRHARARVNIENCIEMLKGRFQSLRGMRMPIGVREDVSKVSMWVHTCCILHNFLIAVNDKADESWISEGMRKEDADEDKSVDEEEVRLRRENTRHRKT